MRPHARPSAVGSLDLLTWRSAPRAPWSSFRLLSWNLLADVHLRRDWYPASVSRDLDPTLRRQRLLRSLTCVDADVLALQEVEPGLLPDLSRAFPGHHLSHAAHGGEGLAVLVRGGADRVEAVPLPGGRKQALLVVLPGGWRLAVVHLRYGGTPAPGSRLGLEQLDTVLERSPDLLCGDLNSEPGWPERQRARAAGLVDHSPSGPTCNVHARLQALDVLLARPGWSVQSEPLPTITRWTPMPSEVHPSDHLPITATLRAPSQR